MRGGARGGGGRARLERGRPDDDVFRSRPCVIIKEANTGTVVRM